MTDDRRAVGASWELLCPQLGRVQYLVGLWQVTYDAEWSCSCAAMQLFARARTLCKCGFAWHLRLLVIVTMTVLMLSLVVQLAQGSCQLQGPAVCITGGKGWGQTAEQGAGKGDLHACPVSVGWVLRCLHVIHSRC